MVVTIVVIALVVALIVSSVALGRVLSHNRQLREERDELLRRLERPAPSLPRQAATFAFRTAVGTAVRVREQGVGGFLTSSIEEWTGIALADRTEIEKVAAPDGTVTIFFSDIVDSTALNEQLGDQRWMALLEAHDKVIRKRVTAHGGHVVKSQGDGFMVAFGDPGEALRAAISMQTGLAEARGRVLRRTPVEVRMGLHTGRAIEKDGDYFGRNVAMAARVASHAVGGEILVSDAVHEGLVADFDFGEPRRVELKGFPGEHDLWPVGLLD
ncbi:MULTISPECIES: adenylate/guanylate cyclase domain-containing protein [unclassified Nocardioides]|uniref:adenylate/guanylate cyclase domain-containing protein n=1 Tax=unclassified Nocardioides TaxID=2615069 RepID=UPI0006F2C4E9|nr:MULTISPECIES: adenylate/guanylate cyclase domain-containing protein [unclassified Nocardioides]KQY54456.1 hypothetical protein ASD30_17520 [Nocardioides sp. Root140]KRF19532.1 hypothetical protein ASH02_23480 [Nocardioides sp. Soil796]